MYTIRRHEIDGVLYLRAEDVIGAALDAIGHLNEYYNYEVKKMLEDLEDECNNEGLSYELNQEIITRMERE